MDLDPSGDPGTYVTAQQIALELGVHLQTAQRYFSEQGLPGRKIGKKWTTTRAAFDQWLTSGPRPTTVEPATADQIRRGGLTIETKD